MKITKSQLKQIIKEELEKVLSEEEQPLNELHPDDPFNDPEAPALVNCDKVRAMKEELENKLKRHYRASNAGLRGALDSFSQSPAGNVTRQSIDPGAVSALSKKEKNPLLSKEEEEKTKRQLIYMKNAEHWKECFEETVWPSWPWLDKSKN